MSHQEWFVHNVCNLQKSIYQKWVRTRNEMHPNLWNWIFANPEWQTNKSFSSTFFISFQFVLFLPFFYPCLTLTPLSFVWSYIYYHCCVIDHPNSNGLKQPFYFARNFKVFCRAAMRREVLRQVGGSCTTLTWTLIYTFYF